MDKILDNNKILNAINNFKLEGDLISFEPYGNGHINDTYLVVTNKKRYILQRINTNVFKEPVRLIENIIEVTEFIKKKIELRNGDTSREVLNLISTKDDKKYFVDENQNYFRVYLFIEDSYSLDQVNDP